MGESTQKEMEKRILEVMRKISGNEMDGRLVQDVVSEAIRQFQIRQGREQDYEEERYIEDKYRKSESFQPIQSFNPKLQRSHSSNFNSESPKSIQGTYSSTFDAQFIQTKPK